MSSAGSPQRITSTANDRVKKLVRARTRRRRDRDQLVIIEEPLVIDRALACGVNPVEIWTCPERHSPEASALYGRIRRRGGAVFEVTGPVMDKIAYRERSDGLLVLAAMPATELDDLSPAGDVPPLIMVLDSVEKPGNLGALLRIADGAGVDAVLVTGRGADPGNPNCLRASRGAAFAVPTVITSPGPAVAWLRKRGVALIAASPEAVRGSDACDYTGPVAIVLGAEDCGLTPAWREAADHMVSIPMAGIGDSLNVAASAAVLLYGAVRQRNLESRKGPR